MNIGLSCFRGVLVASMVACGAVGQSWTPPRTADGQPDLQGIWTNGTATPLERPSELAGKEYLTEQEAAVFEKQTAVARNSDRRRATAKEDLQWAYNNTWYDWGNKVVKTRRSSIIIDPPDGKIPPYTAKGQEMARAHVEKQSKPPAGPEDIGLPERCLVFATAGPPMLPYDYNNNYRILQIPGYVVISIEMIHDVRIIPLDGRPHISSGIEQWLGDSRGHWEGNTLVVDTTNFNGKTRYAFFYYGITDENYHLTERFTRTDPDTILYRFTIDDPTIYTRPFTGELTMSRTGVTMYEYACQEGNYAMADMLAGARAEERRAAGPTKK
jgi:hypothetical protein